MNLNDNQVFISWSGKKAQACAECLKVVFQTLCPSIEVFYSQRIENGKQWLQHINNALKTCQYGLILVTDEDRNSQWLNFEAGALYKGDDETNIIPIYIGMPIEACNTPPLSFFQSRYQFTYKDIREIVLIIATGLSDPVMPDNRDWDAVKERIDTCIARNQLSLDAVSSFLSKRGSRLDANKSFGVTLNENDFYEARKFAVQEAEGNLIIAGPSLVNALSAAMENRNLMDAITQQVRDKKISEIDILITDLSIFEKFFHSTNNEVVDRIVQTQNAIKSLFDNCRAFRCQVNLYALPFFDIDHAVITDRYLLFRTTKLWTKSNDYKGEFQIYCKQKYSEKERTLKTDEYYIHKRYLKHLMLLCTQVNLDIDAEIAGQEPFISKIVKDWRRLVRQQAYTHVHLYKLYQAQLMSWL